MNNTQRFYLDCKLLLNKRIKVLAFNSFNLKVNVFLLFDPSVNIYFQNRFKIPYHSKNGKTGGGEGGGVGARSLSSQSEREKMLSTDLVLY